MESLRVTETAIPGLLLLEPKVFGDERGYFMEGFSRERYEAVCETDFVQDNESRSVRGVLRGLHYQRPPHAQAKLVSVAWGRIWDVAVDLREGSETFGRHVAVELSDVNHRQLFIPQGFAHGFCVLSDTAVVRYKVDDYYHPECEGGVRWDDPTLAIPWPLDPADLILSKKDRQHPSLEWRDAILRPSLFDPPEG